MKNENWEHCKAIAETLEKYVNLSMYRCPECGAHIEWDNDNYNDDDATYTCPECGATFAENELDSLHIWDYFDDVYDVEFRIDGNKEYRSAQIMIACGGPNIYIDTASKAVELYWWGERASYLLSCDAAEAVDEWAEDYWRCL